MLNNKKMLNNKMIRNALKENNVQQWKLADLLGISEFTMARRMRYEMPKEEQKEIISIIEKYAKERDK